MKKNNKKSKIIDSIVSRGSEFKGEFSIEGNIKVDGVIRGRIISDGVVIIGTQGIGLCDIIAKEVIIGGELRGNIIALKSLSVLSTGNLKGNIIAPSLSMEDGVSFNGYCKIDYKLFSDKTFTLKDMINLGISTDSNSRLIVENTENDTSANNNDNKSDLAFHPMNDK